MSKSTNVNSLKDFIDFFEEIIEGFQKEDQESYNSEPEFNIKGSQLKQERKKTKKEKPLDIVIKNTDNKIIVAVDINRMDNIEIDIILPEEINYLENLYNELLKIRDKLEDNFVLVKFRAKRKTLNSFIEQQREEELEKQDFEEIEFFIILEGIKSDILNLDKVKYKKDKDNNVLVLTIPFLKNRKQSKKIKID